MASETDKFENSTSIGQPAARVQDTHAQGTDADAAAADAAPPAPVEGLNSGQGAEGPSGGEVAISPDIALPQIDAIPDFEPGAADCFNRALQIALSLGHASFSSDHLMLALTMDQQARKLLQRVGDIGQLREAAMIKLGKMHWKFARRPDRMDRFPSPTSDLEELRKMARHAAADRDQRVAINDLVNAFPTKDGRLVYGLRETAESVPAILERIESRLVPRVSEFLSKFEVQMRESAERQLEAALKDFGERQLKDVAERQRTSLEDISREFKERHLAALEEIGDALQMRQLGALEAMGKQVQHDLETLAIVLTHFRDRLNQQEQEAPKPEAGGHLQAEPPAASAEPTEPTGRR
jgi:hypothetical protein